MGWGLSSRDCALLAAPSMQLRRKNVFGEDAKLGPAQQNAQLSSKADIGESIFAEISSRGSKLRAVFSAFSQ